MEDSFIFDDKSSTRVCDSREKCSNEKCVWKDGCFGNLKSFSCKFVSQQVNIIPKSEIKNAITISDSKLKIRTFSTGATKDSDSEKLDYEGFFSPLALHAYASYLHEHRVQSDGTYRDSDNWQKGIPVDVHMKSTYRHCMDVWAIHRGYIVYKEKTETGEKTHILLTEPEAKNPNWKRVTIENALGGLIFGSMGYLHEYLKDKDTKKVESGCGSDCKCKK